MNLSAIILAAGMSRRMGKQNKLLLPINGKPLVQRVVDEVLASGFAEVIVVLGHEKESVRQIINRESIRFVDNERYREGMGTSIASGVSATMETSEGFAIFPSDLPDLRTTHIVPIIRAFEKAHGLSITMPSGQAKHGHPKIFPARFRKQLCFLSGDHGAKKIIQASSSILEVELETEAPRRDIDAL